MLFTLHEDVRDSARLSSGCGAHSCSCDGAISQTGFFASVSLPVKIRMAETIAVHAMTTRPICMLPVHVLVQPNTAGPQKPPDKPTVLINAMPPAAAVPSTSCDGIAQNTV